MHRILSSTPMESVDGHVDATYNDRTGWSSDMGATILPMLVGDEHCGPFIVLSYVEPTEEQMPLSFAHAHASDNWRISVRGTTNMGRDTYEQGQFRFHDGGVPYASDNFAWGPDGGYGIIMFADRRGFAIRPGEGGDRRTVATAAGSRRCLLGHRHAGSVPGRSGDRDDDGSDDAIASRRRLRRLRGVGRDLARGAYGRGHRRRTDVRTGARLLGLRGRLRGPAGPRDRFGDDRGSGVRVSWCRWHHARAR